MPSRLNSDEKIGHIYNPCCHCPTPRFCSDCDQNSISKAAFYRRFFLVFWSYLLVCRLGVIIGNFGRYVLVRSTDNNAPHDQTTDSQYINERFIFALDSISQNGRHIFDSYIYHDIFR